MPKTAIPIPESEVAEFCRRWRITEFALFGSVLRDDFRPDSDADVLVTFADDARWGLLDLGQMRHELVGILGREVDLVERRAVERSESWIRRRHALETAETITDAPALIALLEPLVPSEPAAAPPDDDPDGDT